MLSRSRYALLAGALLAFADPAAAQRAEPARFVLPAEGAYEAPTAALRVEQEHSTFLERLMASWAVGAVGTIGILYGVHAVTDGDQLPDGAVVPILALAQVSSVTAGVVLATGSREGTNIPYTLAMATLGTAPLLLLAGGPHAGESAAYMFTVTWITSPVFASAFHRPASR